jgi:uncharacterized SAM-binding protein YcdF (DUF218 family)
MNFVSSEPKHLPLSQKADVIIVLGAAVWAGGVASPSLKRRALHGAKLVKLGHADILIASGGEGRHPPTEASVIRTLAVKEGLAQDGIILDEKSTSTLESAINCKNILQSNDWSSAIVVSDRYHLFRAVFLLRRLGLTVFPSAADTGGTGTSRLRWYWLHARELFAIPWSWIRIFIYLRNSLNRKDH